MVKENPIKNTTDKINKSYFVTVNAIIDSYGIPYGTIEATQRDFPSLHLVRVKKNGRYQEVRSGILALTIPYSIDELSQAGLDLPADIQYTKITLGNLLSRYTGWLDKLSQAAENKEEISGNALHEESIYFSRNGNPHGSYSIREVSAEIINNLKIVERLIVENSPYLHPNRDPLWERYHNSVDLDKNYYRNLLVEIHLPLIIFEARKVHNTLPLGRINLDELINAGSFGLMDAIRDFEPERGTKFITYAPPRIKGAILDELRSTDYVNKYIRKNMDRLQEAKNILSSELGRSPTDKELAGEMGVSLDEYLKMKQEPAPKDQTYNTDGRDDNRILWINSIKDIKSQGPLEIASTKQMHELCLGSLKPEERFIIESYYEKNMTLEEIAGLINISSSTAGNLHKRIIDKLRELVEQQYLIEETTNAYHPRKRGGPINTDQFRGRETVPLEEFYKKFRNTQVPWSELKKRFWDNPRAKVLPISKWGGHVIPSENIPKMVELMNELSGRS